MDLVPSPLYKETPEVSIVIRRTVASPNLLTVVAGINEKA
jgi:hypothetical protein